MITQSFNCCCFLSFFCPFTPQDLTVSMHVASKLQHFPLLCPNSKTNGLGSPVFLFCLFFLLPTSSMTTISNNNSCVEVSVWTLLPALRPESLQSAVSFLVVSVSAACEGQRALVHTMHVQPSFPPHDVTAHSNEHDSRVTPCLLMFSLWRSTV